MSIYLFLTCDNNVLDCSQKILYTWPVVGDGGYIYWVGPPRREGPPPKLVA